MGDTTLDTLKRLIVGRRGRARADRLVVTSADGEQRPIAIKPQRNASTYLDLVESCAPVRIEAFAGDELVGAWGEAPAPPLPRRAPPPPATTKRGAAASVPPPMKKKRVDPWAVIERVTSHMNTLLASAYKGSAERDSANWASLAGIAQHHSDRASNAELRHDLAMKSVRMRDKAINERDSMIVKMGAKIHEIEAASSDDKRTEAFMELLGLARGTPMGNAAAAAAGAAAPKNGAAKKAAAS